jgi:membrane protein YdbS with pleckstrin-like domain
MPVKKHLQIGFLISLVISMVTIVPLNDLSLFSGMGIAYAIGGAILIIVGPIAVCSIPAGVHWLIWRERLNGNELSIYAIWFFTCLSLCLASLSLVLPNQ